MHRGDRRTDKRSARRLRPRRPRNASKLGPMRADAAGKDVGILGEHVEIAEQFEVPPDRIEAVLTYAKTHRVAHPL